MYNIHFYFEEQRFEPVFLDNIDDGQTILEIALKNDIELHHNCGGVCSCTTCHVYIEQGIEHIDEVSRREEDFLDRVREKKFHSRLGCQSLLLEGNGFIKVKVPDQSVLPDEYDF